jgi:hypothetical protein
MQLRQCETDLQEWVQKRLWKGIRVEIRNSILGAHLATRIQKQLNS